MVSWRSIQMLTEAAKAKGISSPVVFTPEIRAKIVELSKPTKVGDKWFGAYLGARKIAEINKKALQLGEEVVIPKKEKKPFQFRLKGSIVERQKEAREKMIATKMAKMPKLVADYKAEMRAKRAERAKKKFDPFNALKVKSSRGPAHKF
eukprot:Nk52_evm1s755 gene=Nk52_evmTU1s755